MTLDARSRRLWQRISPAQRTAFISCFLTGYLVHLYAFTNTIPNSDGLSRMFDLQQMTIGGRWFLHYATMPNSFTQMPAVIGLFSMLFLSLAAALVVDLLRMKSRVLSGAVGAVMAAFPAMGFTFLYMFTASAYCISIFLAVLSVWLARKGRLGFIFGVVALALSMGIYQAYVTVAIGLAILVVFREILDPSAEFHGTLNLGLRMMACLALGAISYFLILQIFLSLKDLELFSYLGMDSASGSYPFAQLPSLVLRSYREVLEFFFVPGSDDSFTTGWMVTLDVIALLLGAALFVNRLLRKNLTRERWRPVTAVILLALLPMGMNFAQLLSPMSTPTPLMKYSFVLFYVAVLLLADLNDVLSGKSCLVPATALWTALLLVFCLNMNNLLYTVSGQAHRATESYITRMMARVEDCPGYTRGMEVAIIGAIPADQLRSQVESYSKLDHYSVPLHSLAPLNKHIYYYLEDWLNIPLDMPSEEVMIAISDSKAFHEMPLYPEQGSVQVLDGRVVVKLQEEYHPKSQFELDYENRH